MAQAFTITALAPSPRTLVMSCSAVTVVSASSAGAGAGAGREQDAGEEQQPGCRPAQRNHPSINSPHACSPECRRWRAQLRLSRCIAAAACRRSRARPLDPH